MCVKNYNSDVYNNDVVIVDYMITGGRRKDPILIDKKIFSLTPSPLQRCSINVVCKRLQTGKLRKQKLSQLLINSFRGNLFVLLALDPCIDVTCHYHCLCKAFGLNDARCVAVDSCPSYQEPVCSSNGTTYDNECFFRQEMCLQQLNFSVQHPGSCEGKKGLNALC